MQKKKRVQALGGAKNHCVVMLIVILIKHKRFNGCCIWLGRREVYGSSVAVAVKYGDKLVKNLKTKVENLKVGPGMDKNSEMGPLVTNHLKKSKVMLILVIEGAELVVDGEI